MGRHIFCIWGSFADHINIMESLHWSYLKYNVNIQTEKKYLSKKLNQGLHMYIAVVSPAFPRSFPMVSSQFDMPNSPPFIFP